MNHDEPFFFISYSQKNIAVDDDLVYFDKESVNYWIDKDGMRATDNTWVERARQTIFDKKCRGALFYLCENSLKSDAVEKEIDLVNARREENTNFFVIAVLVGGKSIPNLIKNVYMSVDNSALEKNLPLSRIVKIANLFTDEKIFIVRYKENLAGYYGELIKNLIDFEVILNKESLERKLLRDNELDPYRRFSFGTFYNEELLSDVYLMSYNVFEELNGNLFIKLNDGFVRAANAIKWIILDYSDGKMKLISEQVLERIPGKDIDNWLNDYFYNLAFSSEEKQKIVGKVRTLSFDEYSLYNSKNNINPTNGKFWLNSVNVRKQQNMLMCVSGSKIDQIGLRKDIRYGIRPVIEIKYRGNQNG